MNTDPWVPAGAATTLLGCSYTTLWRRVKNDATFPIPSVISGRRFWRQSELMAYMESHRLPVGAA